METFGAVLVYSGLLALLFGVINLARPWRRLGIRSRTLALGFAVIGVAVIGGGFALPVREHRVPAPETQLDQVLPSYQFGETHKVSVAAPPQRVYAAIREVGPEEVLFYQTLTWLRRFGRSGPESILNAPAGRPLLDTATRRGFFIIAEEPGREIVLAVAAAPGASPAEMRSREAFQALDRPGTIKIAMNFRVGNPDGSGHCILTTETRVYGSDASVRRTFARYWRVIYPGSSLIRHMWLRAIKRRAERT